MPYTYPHFLHPQKAYQILGVWWPLTIEKSFNRLHIITVTIVKYLDWFAIIKVTIVKHFDWLLPDLGPRQPILLFQSQPQPHQVLLLKSCSNNDSIVTSIFLIGYKKVISKIILKSNHLQIAELEPILS